MQPIVTASIIAVGLIGCLYLGQLLRRVLPAHHLNDESQDAVKLGTALLATLTALVLGLLVSSAKSTFDTWDNGIMQQGAKIITLDRLLARYGPEATEVRHQLRRSVAAVLERLWPEEKTGLPDLDVQNPEREQRAVSDLIAQLSPRTEYQRTVWTEAVRLGISIAESRWQLVEEARSSLPVPLLILLSFWLGVLFLQIGLFSPTNATVMVMLIICALSAAGAIFLILELSRPLEGLLKVSSAPLREVFVRLGQ